MNHLLKSAYKNFNECVPYSNDVTSYGRTDAALQLYWVAEDVKLIKHDDIEKIEDLHKKKVKETLGDGLDKLGEFELIENAGAGLSHLLHLLGPPSAVGQN